MIATSLGFSAFMFIPNIYINNCIFISVAHAEIKEYIGVETAMFDFGEDDENIVNTVKLCAQTRAIQAAKDKAGVYIRSYSKTLNGVLNDDDISVITNDIVDVVKTEYKKLPYKAYDVNDKELGKIGFMYEATVKVKIDTSGISNYIKLKGKLKEEELSTLIIQNKELQNNINKNNNQFENLRKRSETVKTEQERNQIKSELNKLDKEFLYNQNIEAARKAKSKGKYNNAIKYYDEAIKINSNKIEAVSERDDIYKILFLDDYHKFNGKDFSKNPEEFKKLKKDFINKNLLECNNAIRNNPNDVDAYKKRARTYMLSGDARVSDDIIKIYQLEPQNNFYRYLNDPFDYSSFLKNKYDINLVINTYNKILKINPNEFYAYYCIGKVYYAHSITLVGTSYNEIKEKTGYIKKAIENCTKAIEINHDFIEAYFQRARAYNYLSLDEKAVEDYSKVIQLNQSDKRSYKYRLNSYIRLKDYNKSIEDCNKLIEFSPKYSYNYLKRGQIYCALKDYNKAIENFTRAMELDKHSVASSYISLVKGVLKGDEKAKNNLQNELNSVLDMQLRDSRKWY